MPKIEIFKDDHDVWKVVVGGVDMAGVIAAGSLRIELPSGSCYPLVHMTLRARELNVTLPEATINAVEALLHDDPVRHVVDALREYEKRGRA